MKNDGGEPGSAPQSEKWYKLKLGSSFKDQSSTKFCTLRYEFKPASIDKSQAGSLHKNKENRVTVEFLNNQPGKPKVSFEGSSEDYKDNDGVLFFDGETFRLERLHRAVKRLRHVRLPGESASATCMDARSPPLGKTTNKQTMGKTVLHSLPVEVEKIDIGEPDSPDPKPQSRVAVNRPIQQDPFALPADTKAYEPEDDMDLDLEIDDDTGTPNKMNAGGQDAASIGLDINIPQPGMDDEIADVDDSDDEPGKGTNAAEALRAQVNAQGGQHSQESSSSSSSSGSGSSGSGSGSGSGSSSSDSDSDADSHSSAGDIDI